MRGRGSFNSTEKSAIKGVSENGGQVPNVGPDPHGETGV